ncbi:MAG: hypothetical protein U1E00_08820, partial [Pseudoxanthomonas sp.]|nr:hypothetical protein [Pseudoxanthomonas sp.]
ATTRDLREQDLPGHLRGDQEDVEGFAQGEVVDGDEAIAKALARIKLPIRWNASLDSVLR